MTDEELDETVTKIKRNLPNSAGTGTLLGHLAARQIFLPNGHRRVYNSMKVKSVWMLWKWRDDGILLLREGHTCTRFQVKPYLNLIYFHKSENILWFWHCMLQRAKGEKLQTGNKLLVVNQLQRSVGSNEHQLLAQFGINPGLGHN